MSSGHTYCFLSRLVRSAHKAMACPCVVRPWCALSILQLALGTRWHPGRACSARRTDLVKMLEIAGDTHIGQWLSPPIHPPFFLHSCLFPPISPPGDLFAGDLGCLILLPCGRASRDRGTRAVGVCCLPSQPVWASYGSAHCTGTGRRTANPAPRAAPRTTETPGLPHGSLAPSVPRCPTP